MIKTLLVRPPELREASFAQFYTLHESLGIGYLAAYLRVKGYPVEILDAQIEGLNLEKTIETIKAKDFDLLGVSIISPLAFSPAIQVIRGIKALPRKVHVCIGGQYPTFLYEPILRKHPEIDTVVRFEGEETLLELVAQLNEPESWPSIKGIAFRRDGQVLATPPRPLLSNLDVLPFPARDKLPLLIERGGLPAISSSRGCPGQCSFCSVCAFYGTPQGKVYRARTPENVVEEIKSLKGHYGCDELWFVDDNFLGPGRLGQKRVRHLFSLLKKEDLKLNRIDYSCRADSVVQDPSLMDMAVKQGAGLVYLGVEAGVQRLLDLYNKGTTVIQNLDAIRIIKESGAELKMEFIFFNPWITFEEVKETLSILEKMKVYDPYILTSILTIMRDTPLAYDIEVGRLRVFSPPREELKNFDMDSFIPYQIEDERVRILFRIVSAALSQFEPALYAIYALSNVLREKKRTLGDEVLRQYSEIVNDYNKLINETSLDVFKEVMAEVEKVTYSPNSENVLNFEQSLIQKALRFATFLSSILNTQRQALLEKLHELNRTT
ncbi:MAG: B12-binding domain-containing radical SAM protein [Deltaproteobacteria bacterium]|nr:B12-binding domain-containing radical SAM protein [Deltaproteobacteria bacterium]MBM4321935.1 B12-binding domain-containing radical SAM protein [Deltaproteobacteria bacterium]